MLITILIESAIVALNRPSLKLTDTFAMAGEGTTMKRKSASKTRADLFISPILS
jgi:hypothetical protein